MASTLRLEIVRTIGAALIAAGLMTPGVARSFTFTKIVDNYTPIPGSPGQTFSFNNSDVPEIGASARVVFDTGDMSVWTARPDGSQLAKALDTTTPIPGWTGTFQEYYGSQLQILNDTVVLIGTDCAACSGVGIYTVPAAGGTVTKLVDKNTPVPDGGKNFSNFTTDFTVAPNSASSGIFIQQSTGSAVFQNSQQVYALPISSSRANDVAGDWDSPYTPPDPYCCIADSPSLNRGIVALRMSTIFGHASVQTVNVHGDPSSFRMIADSQTATPGGRRAIFSTISRWDFQ